MKANTIEREPCEVMEFWSTNIGECFRAVADYTDRNYRTDPQAIVLRRELSKKENAYIYKLILYYNW